MDEYWRHFQDGLSVKREMKAPVRLLVQYALGDLILVVVYKVLVVYKVSIVISADCTLLFKIYCSFYRSILKGPHSYCT